jgi:hypothetical protein
MIKKHDEKSMKCSIGDIVRFKVGTAEILEGKVQYIEKSPDEETLYINSFSGWAYKVAQKRIISRVTLKNKSSEQNHSCLLI